MKTGARIKIGSVPARRKLTPRYNSILCELANGISNKEIAYRLGLTYGSTKGYISHILVLTGCSSRAELMLKVTSGEIQVTGYTPRLSPASFKSIEKQFNETRTLITGAQEALQALTAEIAHASRLLQVQNREKERAAV